MEQVVLPTPPFWFAIEITLVNASPSAVGREADVANATRLDDRRGARRRAIRVIHNVRGMSMSLCKDDASYTRSCPPSIGPIAQWSEHPAHNRLVAGSIPAGPTTNVGGRPVSTADKLAAPRRAARGGASSVAATKRIEQQHATRQADGARAARAAARRRIVHRARRVRHASRHRLRPRRGALPRRWRRHRARHDRRTPRLRLRARTSRSSAARCPRRTPRRSARSWTWRWRTARRSSACRTRAVRASRRASCRSAATPRSSCATRWPPASCRRSPW